jgi:hypothetical protein
MRGNPSTASNGITTNCSFCLAQNLFDLRAEVIFTDQLASLVQGNLTGDEYDCTTVHRGHLGIAGGLFI